MEWLSTAATSNPACDAAPRSNAFATHRTKPTTAPTARPAASCWPTVLCRASCGKTGPGHSRNWSRLQIRAVELLGERGKTYLSKSPHLRYRRMKRRNTMRSWQGMLSAPFEKRRGGTLKLLIDVTLPSIVRVFVYVSTVQAQYPGLNVPARDEMNDLL